MYLLTSLPANAEISGGQIPGSGTPVAKHVVILVGDGYRQPSTKAVPSHVPHTVNAFRLFKKNSKMNLRTATVAQHGGNSAGFRSSCQGR